ncbi:sorting nexin-1 [Austrofundulus limnaeus]|uniref:Sorting nexin-1 n=1 Tax=Austrofundulus limnaeus TaxID=52670 RepID=A0A2I4D035_AUSLI|nr:PREDICTED: sorting nexin-1-like [Austrofundulus limnaeus]
MASSSERSPPPFPDSEDQDVLDTEEVRGRDSDDDEEDFFTSSSNTPLSKEDTTAGSASQSSDSLIISSQTGNQSAGGPSEEFEDLIKNVDAGTAEKLFDEFSDDFVDIVRSEAAVQKEEVDGGKGEVASGIKDPQTTSTAPVIDMNVDLSTSSEQQPPVSEEISDPLVDLVCDPSVPADAKNPSAAMMDLFQDEGSNIFTETQPTKADKLPQKSLFGDPDEDLFSEPLGAVSKKPTSKEHAPKPAAAAGEPLQGNTPTDIFTEEHVPTVPKTRNTSAAISKTNGVHSEESPDIFAEATPKTRNTSAAISKTNGVHSEESPDIFAAEATVELSLDSPQNKRKKEATSKPSASSSSSSSSSLSAAASLAKPQFSALEELEEEQQEELEDKFDLFVSVKDPEKIGDGMNAYMAYKVSTETTLPMFHNKTFTVKRRFSDFLGLYEKLSEKHGSSGLIVPPPPEKNLLGMTKMKVGKEDSSSADFLERRRGALERYLQRVVNHPMLLQDPDVREFLEKEELPRAVSTQALSSAGFLKMISKATDAVSKMTIKMNESDVWFEEKLQEVEAADQQFRKLHTMVESLVFHRKELSLNTASFAKSAAMLGSAEDNTALSRALSQLAEVEDKMEQLHQDQSANDTFGFAELIADYIRLLGAVRGTFDQRMKAWQRWQDAQTMLQKKRETEAKLLWTNKPDKLQLAKEEIAEWEAKVTQYERDFERVSATVRKEVTRFEKERTKNFKRQIVKYLESLLQSQQQLMKYWEAFLPEAKAIA